MGTRHPAVERAVAFRVHEFPIAVAPSPLLEPVLPEPSVSGLGGSGSWVRHGPNPTGNAGRGDSRTLVRIQVGF